MAVFPLSPQTPLSRRAAGVWVGCFCIGGSACELGVSPIGLVMVTAADRAAATCQRWVSYSWTGDRAKVSKGRSQSPLVVPLGTKPRVHRRGPLGSFRRRSCHAQQRMTEDTPPRRKVAAALSAAVTTTKPIGDAPNSQAEPSQQKSPTQTPAALRERGSGGEGKDSHSRQWRLSMAVFLNRNKRP